MRETAPGWKAFTRVVDNLADARSHVPYRDSKLTRLVAPCLGGRGRLLVGGAVPPMFHAHDDQS